MIAINQLCSINDIAQLSTETNQRESSRIDEHSRSRRPRVVRELPDLSMNVLKSSFFIYLIVLMKSARKENKFSFLTSLFQNLADEENRQRAESVINFIKREAEINRNNQRSNKRENKKNENKKNDDSNDENDSNDDKKCTKCDRVSHSKDECSAINSECFDCHKIDH
jgi:hypothetical protein